MKKKLKLKNAALLISILALFLPLVGDAQTNQTTSPIPGELSSPEHNWGMPTNGIYGEVQVFWDWDRGHKILPNIGVSFINTNANDEGVFTKMSSENQEVLPRLRFMFSDKVLYFAPTNSFSGPIELRNSKGEKLVPLKSKVSSPSAYPASFSLSAVKKNNPYPPTATPSPFVAWRSGLTRFQLGDYFDVIAPGEYLLTVWPKIYKRSSTNSDLCERIDIPPVTVTFKWDGEPSSSK